MLTDDIFSTLLPPCVKTLNITEESYNFLSDSLESLRDKYQQYKILDELVKQKPELFDDLENIDKGERAKRICWLYHRQMELSAKLKADKINKIFDNIDEIQAWVTVHPDSIFEADINLIEKLTYAVIICKYWRKMSSIDDSRYNRLVLLNDELTIQFEKEKSRAESR